MSLLWMSGCLSGFVDPGYVGWIPDLSISTQVPRVEGADVQRVEQYLLPASIADWDPEVAAKCVDGEDVRESFSTQYAMIEVQRWGVLLNGMYTTSLNDGVLDSSGHRGLLLPLLYDQLLEMRLTSEAIISGMPCWGQPTNRVLVVAETATDWALLQRVAYTAHQAGFEHVDLLVEDPSAVSKATASPPYAAFSGGPIEVEARPPRLSQAEIDRARSMLEGGQRVREAGASCVDRLRVTLPHSGDPVFEARPNHGGALAEDAIWAPTIDPDGELEIIFGAERDREWQDVATVLAELRATAPDADLSFTQSDWQTPSYTPIGTVAASTWMSYTKEQWVSVIGLAPEPIGDQLSCIDAQGRVRE